MTRRTALLACFTASTKVVASGQGMGISCPPGQPNRLIIAFGSLPYEIGSLQVMFQQKILNFTAQEIWDALGGK